MTLPSTTSSGTAPQSVSEAFLARLKARGVSYLYVCAGTDTAPIVEAYAASEVNQATDAYPEPVVTTHENLAVGMAHGYAMVTGRPQAVMLHVTVGTANAVCGLMNAARGQVPLLFTAGRTPIFEHGRLGSRSLEIHWGQEMFDQHGMLRELVKWEYELRDGDHLAAVVDRALDISMAPPRGPVALMLPREVLAADMNGVPPPPTAMAPAVPAPDPASVSKLADAFAASKVPVIVCTASGADPTTLPLLVELAERYGIGVVEARSRYVCFPASHPLHLGHDMRPVLGSADTLLFLESDVPWVPERCEPQASAFVAQAGLDPLCSHIPIRTHRSDLTLVTGCATLLRALDDELKSRMTVSNIEERRTRLTAIASEARAKVLAKKQTDENYGGAITKEFLSRTVFESLPQEGIVINEYPAVRECMPFDEAATYFSTPTSAGLGWGLPAALGVQQASPGRTVVAMLGDGAYIFANPAACHHAARLHGLPVVTVVFDNGGWDAVESAAVSIYPEMHSSEIVRRVGRAPLSSLGPTTDFKRYIEASDGLGLSVERREDLAPALEKAYAAARVGKHSLVHVIGR